MTSTAATTATVPPAPTGTGALPPTMGPGTGSTTGGGAATTPATTTPPATAGTSTSFVPATAGGGATYQTIPAPGSCTTPPPVPGKDPAQGAPVQQGTAGGGAVAGVNGQALAPVLQQLTGVIGQLSTLVGGISGGGPGGKTPEQAPPKTPAQDATQGGGAVAGAAGGGAPGKVDPKLDPKQCNMDHGTKGGGGAAGPTPSTVAGANGTPAADAAGAAGQVQGGGGAAPNDAILTALKGVIEALNALVSALGGQVAGGGPGGKNDPAQKAPEPPKVGGDQGPGQKDPIQKTPEPPQVGGDQGPGQKPGQVGGEQGPDQTPAQVPPPVGQVPPAVPQVPPAVPQTPPAVPQVPPTQVGGEQGPGQKPGQVGGEQGPGQKPPITPPAPPEVGGANGGPPNPNQVPGQVPTQVGGVQQKPEVTQGTVVLDNDDARWSAKLTAKGGKADSSVELWGDPHVVIELAGKKEKFDIGFGAGAVTLFDGTKITWDTYDKGDKNQFILRDFKVDSPGAAFDRSVTTRDRNGDKGDQMNLTTALTEAHLTEFAAALRTMQGPMSSPLKNGTWVSPAYHNPTQGGGSPIVQTAVLGANGGVVQQTAVAGVQQVDQVAQSA